MKRRYLLLLLLLLRAIAYAQPETRNWRFGKEGGLVFPLAGPPAVMAGSALTPFTEACSAISDAQGRLLCCANGAQVWDRNNVPMPNGALRFGHISATQGALLVPSPRNKQECYLFTVDAIENGLANGLHYSVVDMSLRGGLGDIGALKEVAVPLPGGQVKLTEKLTAVLLPNGRDYWIIVHGWDNNAFYSFLLSPAGLHTEAVVSRVGAVHQADGNSTNNGNALGWLRVSPDGQRLAMAQLDVGIELFDFDGSTGRVSNAHPVVVTATPAYYYYGLEFSADGTKLYVGGVAEKLGYPAQSVYQIDLTNHEAVVRVGTTTSTTGALLRGNDNRIYISSGTVAHLGVIGSPNRKGPACDFQAEALPLAPGARLQLGLPNFPGAVPVVRLVLNAASNESCVGAPTVFDAALLPAAADAVFTWDFGDPAAGATNTAVGAAVSHTYATAGTYIVQVSTALPTGTIIARQTIVVAPLPGFSLAPRRRALCAGQALNVDVGAMPAGTTYRWQDGLTTTTRAINATGRYILTVTSPQGCTARDSVEVDLLPAPVVQLGRDNVLCAGQPLLMLSAGPQPVGTTYHWQDGSTEPTFAAREPGRYEVEVRNAAGCTSRAALVVPDEFCPYTIPNIITPDGDPNNEYFVLNGLIAPSWSLVVFDRYGREVFRQPAYDNRWNAAGRAAGLYYYLLEHRPTGRRLKGWVEVVRADR
jgi:hypothetical protein